MRLLLLFAALSALFFTSCNSKVEADLIITGARIYTVDSAFSVVQAMAISDGKIIATGSDSAIKNKYRGVEEINAAGKFIFPGFIDAHCHFTGYATDMWKCSLTGTTSFDEVLARLKAYSSNAPMQWIYGRGWDQNDWTVKEFPDRAELDSMFPDRPVFLKRVDGHAALLNQKALDLAGITAASTFAGGEVEIKNGRLTGMLIDNAMHAAEKAVPLLNDTLALKYFEEAQKMCFAAGLTGVHDCGVSEHTITLLKRAYTSQKLKMKIFALMLDDTAYYDTWGKRGPLRENGLHVGGFKFYADGALGSRGAAMKMPYNDKPGWRGLLLRDSAHFVRAAKLMYASNLQMCTHAIGDSGNALLLEIYAKILGGKNDRRWRIEHAQVVDEKDFHFFTDFNIIPSVQPTHATSDMYWAGDRVGKARLANAYAYKRLLQTNGWMPLGTDFPVEYIEPLKTFFAAVIREDAKGFPSGGFQKENSLAREEAIRGMTIWAAKAAFEEKEKGSLEAGKAADFVVLDTDLMSCSKEKILSAKILNTYLNGKKVH